MPQHRITHHDAELEVTYDHERACPPQRERGGGNIIDPGNDEGVTVTAVHLVDPVVEKLWRSLARLALAAGPVAANGSDLARALDAARQLLGETKGHAGPELTDDWFTDEDRNRFTEQLLEHEHDVTADDFDEDAWDDRDTRGAA